MDKNIFDSPLFNAAKRGILKEVEKLCNSYTGKSKKEREFYSALYIASYQGHEDIVKTLLCKGANPNYCFKNCLPPLHAAAQKGRISIGKLLLDHGASIDPKQEIEPKNTSGESKESDFFSTPLLTAARGGHENMVKFLLDHGANIEAKLYTSSAKVSSEIERLFFFADYNNSEIDSKSLKIGYRSLHLAVEAGEKRVVKILLQNGANVNAKSDLNVPPLFVAILRNQESIIQILIKGGADTTEIVNGLTLYQYLLLRDVNKSNSEKKQNSAKDSNSEEKYENST